ncbi:hypothetical protein [Lichenicoccus sp.]|uniref:hypothetical protein n=1 Tax=Lichenicoccus sp. TaxID=2781899 RepID=UPI003D0F3B2C
MRKVSTPQAFRAGGSEQLAGGFLNALYDIPLRPPVQPYLGVGAGGEDLRSTNLNFTLPGVRLGYSDASQSAGAFAYQAIAGFSVPLPWLHGLAFAADDRFVGLLDPLPAIQEESSSALNNGRREGNAKFGNVLNH